MSVRAAAGVVMGTLLFGVSVGPHSLHINECSPYAAQLGINPGIPTPDSPYGITACGYFSVTAIAHWPFALFTLLFCMAASVLLIRLGGFRSVMAVVATGIAGAVLGGLACFIYSGLGLRELLSDPGARFSLLVVAVAAAIMASLELRRLPNKSLERTRGR